MKNTFYFVLCFLVLSCSTVKPKNRIEENIELFSSFPMEVQQQIQSGNIDKGFTEDMVYLAKGKPSEKVKFERKGKVVSVWRYFSSKPSLSSASGAVQASTGFEGAYGYPTFGPRPSVPTPMLYQTPSMIVDFEDGKVTSWKE